MVTSVVSSMRFLELPWLQYSSKEFGGGGGGEAVQPELLTNKITEVLVVLPHYRKQKQYVTEVPERL